MISIHALREEGDVDVRTSPCRKTDFYPRPPRGGRRPLLPGSPLQTPISIHALREEGDGAVKTVRMAINISIHALREEGDPVLE